MLPELRDRRDPRVQPVRKGRPEPLGCKVHKALPDLRAPPDRKV